MGLRKFIAEKKKQYEMYTSDKDHISSLRFDAQRKFNAGLISEMKYERLLNEATEKEARLKSVREHYWQVEQDRKENSK